MLDFTDQPVTATIDRVQFKRKKAGETSWVQGRVKLVIDIDPDIHPDYSQAGRALSKLVTNGRPDDDVTLRTNAIGIVDLSTVAELHDDDGDPIDRIDHARFLGSGSVTVCVPSWDSNDHTTATVTLAAQWDEMTGRQWSYFCSHISSTIRLRLEEPQQDLDLGRSFRRFTATAKKNGVERIEIEGPDGEVGSLDVS